MIRGCNVAAVLRAYLEREQHRGVNPELTQQHAGRYEQLSKETGIDLDRDVTCPWEDTSALRPLFESSVQRYNESTSPFDNFTQGSKETADLWKSFGRRLAAADEERRRALFDLMRELVIRMYGTPEQKEQSEEEIEESAEKADQAMAHIDFW